MALPTAMLNQMAQSSPSSPYNTRKRHRGPEALDLSPTKKRAISADDEDVAKTSEISTKTAARARARRSITRLPQRSVPEATPSQSRSSKNTYEHLESPESTRDRIGISGDRPKTKKLVRRLQQSRVQTASPFKGTKFGALNEMRAGAILTSTDSPAKNTRAKRSNPLERLKHERAKQQSNAPVDAGLLDREPSNSNQTELPDGGNASDGNNNYENEPSLDPKQKEAVTEAGQQLNSQNKQSTGEHSKKNQKEKSVPDTINAATATSMKSGSAKGKRRAHPGGNRTRDTTEDAPNSSLEEQQPNQPRPRKGRPAASEEEKNSRKIAEAQKRKENAEETEAAQLASFNRRRLKFLEGIEDIIVNMGGTELWSQLGGGAQTIAVEAMKGKNEMDTTRSEAVWRPMRNLTQLFDSASEAETREEDEEIIAECLRKLHDRADKEFLTKGEEQRRGDRAVVDIFLYLIPKSIFLLKDAVRNRFHPSYKHSWQEMRMLTKVSINLCETALKWTPKPSTLDTGIRKQVRNNIRPALDGILETIIERIQSFEHQEKIQRNREELTKVQQQANQRRHVLFNKMQARMASCQIETSHKGLEAVKTQHDVVDIDELEDNTAMAHPTRHQIQMSRLQRHGTEEIPAPDPLVEWTKDEECALLNGLQKFRGIDRYTRILETYSWLAGKDIDQCMARAQYYKQAYRHELAEKVARGDHSSDWLMSV